MWVYAVMCVAWIWYLNRRDTPWKNWQWLLSWTLFLPVVLAAVMCVAISDSIEWLKQES